MRRACANTVNRAHFGRNMPKKPKVFGRWHRAFARDERGGVLLMFGLMLLPLMAAVGLAIDAMIAFTVENRIQRALDAAGLAAGRAADDDALAAQAQQFFDANFDTGPGFAEIVNFDVVTQGDQITLSATANVPNHFMQIFGYNSQNLDVSTVIFRQVRRMELALVMDNTGSMRSGNKIGAMRDAALDLVDIVFGEFDVHPYLHVSVVPYTATVNIGADRSSWLDANDIVFDTDTDWFDPTTWKGCVMARTSPFDESEATPATEPFQSFYYAPNTDNVWPPVDEDNGAQNDGTGPNLGCGPEITSLRNSKQQIVDAIQEMLPWHRGGTTGNLGLVWGWRSISPLWRGLWADGTPASYPLDYNSAASDKVVVMLTDGNNQFYDHNGGGPDGSDFTAYGRLGEFGFASLGAARDEIDDRMLRTCQAMKTEGVIIYTITFGSSPSSSTQQLYRDCATSNGHYFHSPSNGDLSSVFKAIGRQLSDLRIAQ